LSNFGLEQVTLDWYTVIWREILPKTLMDTLKQRAITDLKIPESKKQDLLDYFSKLLQG